MPPAILTIPIRGSKLAMQVEVREVLAHVETEFQTIDIVDTEAFGKVMLLDGHVQLASLDEAAYHEALVHVPMLSLEDPRSALVIGGGDGGVLRELCKHRSLEEIVMVEIDKGVIEASKLFLPEISNGAFDDPRVKVRIEDAFGFLRVLGEGDKEPKDIEGNRKEPERNKETTERPNDERRNDEATSRIAHRASPLSETPNSKLQTPNSFDLIVLDITDVYEDEAGGLSEMLFTAGFYDDCRRALSPSGMLVTQSDNHVFCPYSMEAILEALSPHFSKLGSFQALVPSFGGFSAYVWASLGAEPARTFPSKKAKELRLSYLSETTWRLAQEPLPFAPLPG